MAGGDGDDVYVIEDVSDVVTENIDGGLDAVLSRASYTLADNIENLSFWNASGPSDGTGNELDNLLNGDGFSNTLSGLGGDDQLGGGAGDDILLGGEGNDSLDGREGADLLVGGNGADTFVYTLAPSASGVNHIDDFVLGEDQIELNGFAFGHLAAGELSASAFVLGSAAADAGDRIIYDGQTGTLYFDVDGNGATAAVAFATLSAELDLAASNFVIL